MAPSSLDIEHLEALFVGLSTPQVISWDSSSGGSKSSFEEEMELSRSSPVVKVKLWLSSLQRQMLNSQEELYFGKAEEVLGSVVLASLSL